MAVRTNLVNVKLLTTKIESVRKFQHQTLSTLLCLLGSPAPAYKDL